jgi:uncharacterized protein involved in outer membrane biogenesis
LLAAPLFLRDRHGHAVLQSGAVLAASPDSFTLSHPIPLFSAPRVRLESGTISLPATRTGLARGGEVIAMLISGSGPQLVLQDAALTVDFTTVPAKVAHEFAAGEVAPLVEALQTMRFDALEVRDSTLHVKLADGTALALQNLKAVISSKPNGAVRASGSFEFRGEAVAFDTSLGAALDAQGTSRPLKASFSSAPLVASLDGSLLLGDNPQFLSPRSELKTPDLRAAARWLGIDWPAGDGFGPFQVSGELEWAARTLAFQEATVSLDDNTATGTLSINLESSRPSLEGTLGLKTFNLSRYTPGLDAAGQEALLVSVNELSETNFPLIRAIDADVRISADSVTLPGMVLGRSAATIALKDSQMLADIAELEIGDGSRASGQFRVDARKANPEYGLHAKVEAPDVGRSIKAMFGHPTVQGRGTVTVDLTSSGNTGGNLLASLQGRLSVALAEPGRIGLDINRLAATDQQEAPASWDEISQRPIVVDQLDARFVVTNGVMQPQNAEAISGQRALTVNGSIDLVQSQLDLELAVGEITKEATPGTGELEIKKRDIIRLRGPWNSPSIRTAPAHADTHNFGPPSPG